MKEINFLHYFLVNGYLEKCHLTLNGDLNYYKKLLQILKIKKVKDFSLKRIGRIDGDGGYLLLNNFYKGGIAYCFGIANEISFENDLGVLSYDVYMYDYTIDGLPYYRPEFHFYKQGITGVDEESSLLKSLKYFIESNGHQNEKNMILKMDVEGAEWNFLETVAPQTLKQFDQIVFEFHSLLQSNMGEKCLELLKKLNKTHQLVHLHPNNFGSRLQVGNKVFPDVLEATYVNKNSYELVDFDDLVLPLIGDVPNTGYRDDIILGEWNKSFVLK